MSFWGVACVRITDNIYNISTENFISKYWVIVKLDIKQSAKINICWTIFFGRSFELSYLFPQRFKKDWIHINGTRRGWATFWQLITFKSNFFKKYNCYFPKKFDTLFILALYLSPVKTKLFLNKTFERTSDALYCWKIFRLEVINFDSFFDSFSSNIDVSKDFDFYQK